jgi:hypothetical protein
MFQAWNLNNALLLTHLISRSSKDQFFRQVFAESIFNSWLHSSLTNCFSAAIRKEICVLLLRFGAGRLPCPVQEGVDGTGFPCAGNRQASLRTNCSLRQLVGIVNFRGELLARFDALNQMDTFRRTRADFLSK